MVFDTKTLSILVDGLLWLPLNKDVQAFSLKNMTGVVRHPLASPAFEDTDFEPY